MGLTNFTLRIMQVLLMYQLWTYREGILLSVIAWMNLEGTMLCEISQIKTNAIRAHLNEESKTNNHKEQNINTENRLVVSRCMVWVDFFNIIVTVFL